MYIALAEVKDQLQLVPDFQKILNRYFHQNLHSYPYMETNPTDGIIDAAV